MPRFKSALALLSVSLALGACATAPNSTSASAPRVTANASAVDPAQTAATDPIICHDEAVTGSRLESRRVCMRKAQWDETKFETQKAVSDGQVKQINPSGN